MCQYPRKKVGYRAYDGVILGVSADMSEIKKSGDVLVNKYFAEKKKFNRCSLM